MRLVRQLEGTRGDTLQGLAKLLRVQRLLVTGGGAQNPTQKLKLVDTVSHPTRLPLQPPASSLQPPASSLQPPASSLASSLATFAVPPLPPSQAVSVGRKVMAPVLALFLTLPDPQSLIIDERGGSSKQSQKTAKEMQGDPGFLVNGPQLEEAGRKMQLKNGAIVGIPIPRPAYVPPPYVPPPAPKMSPLQLAQHQMTLPKGWEVRIARSTGDVYYYQPATTKSQWDYPKVDAPASNEAPMCCNVGDVVVINGLVSKPELNGCQARVVVGDGAPQGFDAVRGRHHLELLKDSTIKLTVKPSNMQLAAPLGQFNAGDVVVIGGLQSKPELNGCKGCVGAFDVATGRHHVALEDGRALALKPANLALAVPLGQPAP